MTIKAVFFDFDGVVVDSLDVHRRAYERTFQLFGKVCPFSSREIWRARYQSHWERNFLENGFSADEFKAALAQFGNHVDYSDAPVYAGIDKVLEILKTRFSLSIVSTTREAFIREKLEDSGLIGHFDRIFGDWDSSDKTQKVLSALKACGASGSEAVMIGDTESDIQAGKKAGCYTIGVSYGWYDRGRVLAQNPDAIVDSPPEVGHAVLALANKG